MSLKRKAAARSPLDTRSKKGGREAGDIYLLAEAVISREAVGFQGNITYGHLPANHLRFNRLMSGLQIDDPPIRAFLTDDAGFGPRQLGLR